MGRGNKESVPCPPELFENCRVFEEEGECYQDRHHKFWPRPDYTTAVERTFRGLEVNQLFICRALHNAIHATEAAPQKPTRKKMLDAINNERVPKP